MRRVLLVTDPRLRALPPFDIASGALVEAGIDVVLFDAVEVEPTDRAIGQAAAAALEAGVGRLSFPWAAAR